jgi:hypothetical protein
MGKNLVLLVLILLPVLELLVYSNQSIFKWHIGRQHYNAKPLCLAGEPLPQPNHHGGFASYFWDVTTNYGQHVQSRVYVDHA